MDSTEVVRILHTSDWHLGKEVIRESTIDMDRKMLEWILSLCRERSVDCLLISGDVFDVAMPSNEAQRLYYSFLSRLLEAGCRRGITIPPTSFARRLPCSLSLALWCLDLTLIAKPL